MNLTKNIFFILIASFSIVTQVRAGQVICTPKATPNFAIPDVIEINSTENSEAAPQSKLSFKMKLGRSETLVNSIYLPSNQTVSGDFYRGSLILNRAAFDSTSTNEKLAAFDKDGRVVNQHGAPLPLAFVISPVAEKIDDIINNFNKVQYSFAFRLLNGSNSGVLSLTGPESFDYDCAPQS